MLMILNMGAKAEVKVLFGENGAEKFEGTGGTIEVKQEDSKNDKTKVTITLIVTPSDGYKMEKDGIEAYAVISPNGASTRALEISGDALDLTCNDFKDISQKRTYTVDIDSKLALWVKSANFQKKRDGAKATGPVVISTDDDTSGTIEDGEKKLYLIQSYSNEVFYMRNNNRNSATNLNTSNIVTTNSEFYFMDADEIDGTQYYYIVHNGTSSYVYMDGTTAKYGNAPAADATDAVKDTYRFKIVKNSSREAYNIIPKGNTNSLNKASGNWNNADISLATIDNDLSCWNFIAKESYAKTAPPFTVSTLDGDKYYYNVQNNNNQTLYMVPGVTYVSTLASAVDVNDMVWYFVKADITDPYLDYYYIIHPKTGKYLRHRGGGDANTDAVELADYKDSEQARFLYIIVPGTNANETHASTTASSTYCIAPKNVMVYRVENTVSLSTKNENGTVSNNTGQSIKSFKERNGNKGTHWNFVSTTLVLTCNPPTISYDEETNTVSMSHSDGANIYYTTDGSDPTVPATGSTQTYTGPFQPAITVSVIKAVASKLTNGNDISRQESIYFYKTVSSSSEITDMNAAYRLSANFQSSGTIGTSSAPFRGSIDGNYNAFSLGHALIDVAENATIKNIVVSNTTVSGSGNVGTIVNTAKGTTKIYNCGVQGGSISGGTNVGGLVGLIEAGSNVRVVNCYNYANVSASGNGSYAAGIVGKNAGTVGNVRIALCMMYGNVTGASNISPVYGGNHVSNASNFTEYNYWLYRKRVFNETTDKEEEVKIDLTYTAYNDQLAIAEEIYLTRYPFYRHILNTHRELATYFLFDDYDAGHVKEIGHWVVKKGTAKYPIIENWQTDTKKVTEAPTPSNILTSLGNEGYLSVSISINGNSYSASLPITDMDESTFDYTYGKVVLPFANEFEVNTNYSKICTGWKITSVGDQSTFSIPDDDRYNFADRNNPNKDIYDETSNPYIFAQGGNYIVPYGISSISIEANFADAFYLSDASYDIGLNTSYTSPTSLGGTVPSTFHSQTVYTNLKTLLNSSVMKNKTNPHEQAIVLVGNYHFDDGNLGNDKKSFTLMSIDADNNQEPDYGFYSYNSAGRPSAPSMRFDFLPVIPVGMAAHVNGSTGYPNVPIWKVHGWFEMTETCVFFTNQCEIDSGNFSYADDDHGNNRWIINSGYFVQIVRSKQASCSKLSYIQIGGNAYVREFYPGSHSEQGESAQNPVRETTLVPINVTGGEIKECFMTGYNTLGSTAVGSDIRFWCSGGKIHKFLGAYMEAPTSGNVNMTAKIDHALIGRFYGGGTSASAPITGNIEVKIDNSHVDFYCGGPEFGDMSSGKIVKTTANNTIFGEYYGAGFGGTSITYYLEQQDFRVGLSSDKVYPFAFSTYYKRLQSKAGYGVGTCYKFEYLNHSNTLNGVARFYTGYAQFSLATTGNVTNILNGCEIKKLQASATIIKETTTGDFYGAGCQGKVNGTVTSTLTDCKVDGSVYGGGFKAESNKVDVYTTIQPVYSTYKKEMALFTDFGEFPTPEEFTWKSGSADPNDTAKELYTGMTEERMKELGNVDNDIFLTIDGSEEKGSTITGNVFGGGNESKSLSNTTVTLAGNTTVKGSVFGGGNKAEVSGSATVNIE